MLDTLGGFQSENELSQENTIVPSHVPQTITITSVLARSVPLEWYEAVAISQTVCAKLQASGDAGGAVRIDGDHVAIDAAGDVHVAAVRRSAGSDALSQVAELLRLMLGTASVPAPLRLALSQTNVTSSLEEWSKSIAYYERPGREPLIRAVYERAMAVPQPVQLGFAPEPPPVTPAPMVQRTAQREKARPSIARRVPALALALVVAVLVAAGVWFVQARSSAAGAPSAATAGPSTLQSTFSNAMGSLVAHVPAFRESEPVLINPPPAPPSGRWIHLPNGRLTALQMSPTASPLVARSLPLAVTGVSPAIVFTPRPIIGSSFPPVTYSASDVGVVPPVAIYPQFPTRFPPHITDDDFAEFDVIVTETGDVESVRARRVPPTMGEAVRMTMSLSAAKTWRFRPGLKDGEPVRYRQVIRVLNN